MFQYISNLIEEPLSTAFVFWNFTNTGRDFRIPTNISKMEENQTHSIFISFAMFTLIIEEDSPMQWTVSHLEEEWLMRLYFNYFNCQLCKRYNTTRGGSFCALLYMNMELAIILIDFFFFALHNFLFKTSWQLLLLLEWIHVLPILASVLSATKMNEAIPLAAAL